MAKTRGFMTGVLAGQIARGFTLVSLLLMIVWSAGRAIDYGEHALDLWGRPLVEKGAAAIDGPVGFNWREHVGAAANAPARSPWADAWVWTFERSAEIRAGSDLYFNMQSVMLYYYGTFFWHPSRLRVDACGVPTGRRVATNALQRSTETRGASSAAKHGGRLWGGHFESVISRMKMLRQRISPQWVWS